MQIIDLSHPIEHKGIAHPLHTKPMIWTYSTHEETRARLGSGPDGHSSTVKVVQMTDHTGTHVDAPLHFDSSPEAASVDQLPLDLFYGKAICLDLSHIPPKGFITVEDLQKAVEVASVKLTTGMIVLIYTGHGERTLGTEDFYTEFPGLTEEAVIWMGQQGIVNFGVESVNPGHPDDKEFLVHVACRKLNMIHMENLTNLQKLVGMGTFTFAAFPLKIKGGSGSPVRAVAFME